MYRILKSAGVLSCFPTHLMKKYHFTFATLLNEIAEAGFRLEGEFRPYIVHDGRLVRGRVFRFVVRRKEREKAFPDPNTR